MGVEPLDVLLLYSGVLVALAGVVVIIKPLRFLGVRNRRISAGILISGIALFLVGGLWPARLTRAEGSMRIDEVMPAYHFHELHSIRVRASPDRVFQAIRAVTPDEVRFLRILLGIRELPERLLRRGEPTLRDTTPILDQMIAGDFILLVDDPDRELVFGIAEQLASNGITPVLSTPQEFAAFSSRGYVKAAMNFHVQEEGSGWSRVTTETRVLTTDPSSRRKFAWYWRLIYPGSATIRRMLLKAIERRLENEPGLIE